MKALKAAILVLAVTGSGAAYAQDEDEMSVYGFNFGNCQIASLTARWSFRTLLGEPIVGGSWKWEAGGGTAMDCLDHRTFVILKVTADNNAQAYAFVPIDPAVPQAGRGYGYNVSGSPNWDKLFCGFDRDGRQSNCWSAEEAKRFWRGGFHVSDIKLVRRR